MRELTGHKVNGVNEVIVVEVLDEPGHGGACHNYRIRGYQGPMDHHPIPTIDVRFQNGPLKEVGTNGITHEALLAILIDRLEGFQSGQYACDDNQEALDACRKAQTALQRRTLARVARGVEGTHAK